MHTAVYFFFNKERVGFETMLPPMLKNEISSRMQNIKFKNLIRNKFKTRYIIGRICKNHIEFQAAKRKKVEDIMLDYSNIRNAKPSGLRTYKSRVLRIHFHTPYMPGPS